MKVLEAAFIVYPVSDLERARNFYENILELKLGELNLEIEGMPGIYWIEYDLGNVTLAISNAWEPSGQRGPSLALEVDNLEDAVSKLKAAHVSFVADHLESPICCFALITDPDGNAITIHKRKNDGAPS